MPWDAILTLGFGIIKWLVERKAKKKLSDAEFIAHIEAHQKRRQNTGKAAQDFDAAMEEARQKLKAGQENKDG